MPRRRTWRKTVTLIFSDWSGNWSRLPTTKTYGRPTGRLLKRCIWFRDTLINVNGIKETWGLIFSLLESEASIILKQTEESTAQNTAMRIEKRNIKWSVQPDRQYDRYTGKPLYNISKNTDLVGSLEFVDNKTPQFPCRAELCSLVMQSIEPK